MTGPSPDLAALREVLRSDAEKALARDTYVRANPSSLLAVLSLVDDLRAEVSRAVDVGAAWQDARDEVKRELDRVEAENERLREALTIVLTEYRMFVRPQTDQVAGAVVRLAENALAGSPAANEEQQCRGCDGKGEIEDTIDQHGGGAFWTCMRCGGTGKEPS